MSALFPFIGLFRRAPSGGVTSPVAAGDRYFKPGQRHHIWTVERVFQPAGHALPHVVLKRDGESSETYVISVMALMNPHMFRPDRRDPDATDAKGWKRRSADYFRAQRKAIPAEAEAEAPVPLEPLEDIQP